MKRTEDTRPKKRGREEDEGPTPAPTLPRILSVEVPEAPARPSMGVGRSGGRKTGRFEEEEKEEVVDVGLLPMDEDELDEEYLEVDKGDEDYYDKVSATMGKEPPRAARKRGRGEDADAFRDWEDEGEEEEADYDDGNEGGRKMMRTLEDLMGGLKIAGDIDDLKTATDAHKGVSDQEWEQIRAEYVITAGFTPTATAKVKQAPTKLTIDFVDVDAQDKAKHRDELYRKMCLLMFRNRVTRGRTWATKLLNHFFRVISHLMAELSPSRWISDDKKPLMTEGYGAWFDYPDRFEEGERLKFFNMYNTGRAVYSTCLNTARCLGIAMLGALSTQYGLPLNPTAAYEPDTASEQRVDPTTWRLVTAMSDPLVGFSRGSIGTTPGTLATTHELRIVDQRRADGAVLTYNVDAEAIPRILYYLLTPQLSTLAPAFQSRTLHTRSVYTAARLSEPFRRVSCYVPLRDVFPVFDRRAGAFGVESLTYTIRAVDVGGREPTPVAYRGATWEGPREAFERELANLTERRLTPPPGTIFFTAADDGQGLHLHLNTAVPSQRYEVTVHYAAGPTDEATGKAPFEFELRVTASLRPANRQLIVEYVYAILGMPPLDHLNARVFPPAAVIKTYLFGANSPGTGGIDLEFIRGGTIFNSLTPFVGSGGPSSTLPSLQLARAPGGDLGGIETPNHPDWSMSKRYEILGAYADRLWVHEFGYNPFLGLSRPAQFVDATPRLMMKLLSTMLGEEPDPMKLYATTYGQFLYALIRKLMEETRPVRQPATNAQTPFVTMEFPTTYAYARHCTACQSPAVSHVTTDGRVGYCSAHVPRD